MKAGPVGEGVSKLMHEGLLEIGGLCVGGINFDQVVGVMVATQGSRLFSETVDEVHGDFFSEDVENMQRLF